MKKLRELFLIAAVILLAGTAIIPVAAQPANWPGVGNGPLVEAPDAVVGCAFADESGFTSERNYNFRFAPLGASNQIVAAFKTLDICVGANTAPATPVAQSHRLQTANSRFCLLLITDGFGGVRCWHEMASCLQLTRWGGHSA